MSMNEAREPSRRGGARRRALVRFALWVTAVVVLTNTVVFSGASFTSRSDNPGSVFDSGTLLLLNTADGQVVVAANALLPGQTERGTLTLTNAGTVAGEVSVDGIGLTDVPGMPPLSAALTVTFSDIDSGTELWSGPIAALSTASVSLGTLAAGMSREYEVAVTYPAAAADPGLQGAQATLTLRFSGVSL
jgi:hypothetical protein